MNTHPFAGLSPERVLDAVEHLGVASDGRLFPLNSFENRVYLVGREDAEPIIAKFYRPGRFTDAQILEEHAFLDELAEAELPVAAAIPDAHGRTLTEVSIGDASEEIRCRVALFPKLRGRAPELESEENLEWLGRLIARLHQVGVAGTFSTRPPLSIQRLGESGLEETLRGPLLPASLHARYERSVRALLDTARGAFASAGKLRLIRAHGDLHPGNLLWNEQGPVFVDYDDCGMAPAIQDLWMLLPGDPEGRDRALACVLEGYEMFRSLDSREIALIEPLRALRLIHYGGWLSARFEDPAFPLAFPFGAAPRFWEDHLITLEQQRERIEDEAG